MSDSNELSPDEIDARREAALKRLLETPHKPHKPAKSEKEPASSDAGPKPD